MERLNKLQRRLYQDVIITLLLVIISIPVWLNFELTSVAKIASGYDNYNYVQYELLNDASKMVLPYEDDEALIKCETQDLIVYNNSNTLEDYSLVLKINKDTTLNLNNIRINVNYEVDYLNEYEVFEDTISYYYILDKDSIVADAYKYNVSIWNEDISAKDTFLDYELVVL